MNFKELLMKTDWSNVSTYLSELYTINHHSLDEYKTIYLKLLSYDAEIVEGNTIIKVSPDYDVSGVEDDIEYSLSLTPWKQWLGFDVEIGEMTTDEFSAHCLWEMTFYGDEESQEDMSNEIELLSQKIDSNKIRMYQEECPLCKGTSDVFGTKCFCDDGMINVMSFDTETN